MNHITPLLMTLFSAAGFFSTAGMAETSVESGPVIALPEITVLDAQKLPPHESWQYTTIPGFEILSDASASRVKELIQDFQLFREALAQVKVWPLHERAGPPTLLILCGAGGKFDSFLPSVTKTDQTRWAGSVFLHDRMRGAIAVDCASLTTPDDSLVEPNRELYRQYLHLLMSQSGPPPPPWFVEGFAQVARAMEFDRKLIIFGKLQEPGLMSAVGESASLGARVRGSEFDEPLGNIELSVENRGFLDKLKGKTLIPLDRFFAVQENSNEVRASLGNLAIWPQQAYAFVHFCLFGEDTKYRAALTTFLERLKHESPSEALFKECFKLSYKQMLDQLTSYAHVADYQYLTFRAKGAGLPAVTEPIWRKATPSEIGRMKGDALALAGYPELAHDFLVAPYVRKEYDGPLLAALGLWERRAGHDDIAWKFLEGADSAKTDLRPEVYIELARYRYLRAMAQPAAAGGKLSANQVERVVAPLLTAQRQPPELAIVYQLLAATWLQADDRPPVAQVELLIRGAQLYPTQFELILDTALLCRKVGLEAPAKAFLEHGIKYAPPEMKPRFVAAGASARTS